MSVVTRTAAVLILCGLFTACRPSDESPQILGQVPTAGEAANEGGGQRQGNHQLAEQLLEDLGRPRHPSDGGGRAWLEPPSESAWASRSGRWTIHYEAGELGIAEGGMIYFQVSPFWGWSTPQVRQPQMPGYTEVSTGADGVSLEVRTLDQQLLGIGVTGRGLRAGERVTILYGSGAAGARADRFSEGDSRFWIAVDGDGDGVRKILADSPGVAVGPGPAARLHLTLTSTARPGESIRLTVALLDAVGNALLTLPPDGATDAAATAASTYSGEIRLEAPAGLEVPKQIRLRPSDLGRRTIELTAGEPGVVRVRASGPGELMAESNPLQISSQGSRILWGDLQNHSGVSDGTSTPEEQFLYARDVAALDVMSLTDHDHWGLVFLDSDPQAWGEIRQLTRRFHEPERFVTLLGYEWTHWVYGHRHVIYFSDDGELYSSVDPNYDTPQELWDALRGQRAMTIAHHSAGGPVSTDWSIPPDPELEPITEIVSVHGSSEAADSPSPIYKPVPGNYVRDALARGYRLGFLGSSDGHDGHPGLGQLASPAGSGLAAILAEELTRDGVYEAIKSRRVYATNGPRIVLRASFGGYPMGADIPVGDRAAAALPGLGPDTLVVRVVAPSAVERIDIIRSGQLMDAFDCRGESECAFGANLPDLEVGEYLYLRVVQADGGAAWSSPFYFVEPEAV